VALKRIQEHQADDPQSRTRFLHEAEVTGNLEHRGIVPVYGLDRFENGRLFYAMRFVNERWLVETLSDLGELNHMNGHTLDAESNFHAAIGHADKLRSVPFSPTYRSAMGSALINLSEILSAFLARSWPGRARFISAVDERQRVGVPTPWRSRN
jgi:hypothetical protein